jgi:hypothetical protein
MLMAVRSIGPGITMTIAEVEIKASWSSKAL